MAQRNSPERARMLAVRAYGQRSRTAAFTFAPIPAWMNRRTGKPHEHNRAKARRQRRISTDKSWPTRSAA